MRKVVKISVLVYALFGLLIGLLLSVYSLYDRSFLFHMGGHEIHGVWAAVLSLLFTPILMGLVGLGHGIMLWFPAVYIYRKLSKKRKSSE